MREGLRTVIGSAAGGIIDQIAEGAGILLPEPADPAQQDPRTQFYVAYSFYRQGWGRLYQDDALFAQGLEAVNRAIARAPGGRIVVDDADLQMRSGDELKAELEGGLRRDASDFNPARLLRSRK